MIMPLPCILKVWPDRRSMHHASGEGSLGIFVQKLFLSSLCLGHCVIITQAGYCHIHTKMCGHVVTENPCSIYICTYNGLWV